MSLWDRRRFQSVTFKGAPFGNIQVQQTAAALDTIRPILGCVKFAHISDGLSNTLLVAEVIQGQGTDIRGRLFGYSDGAAITTFNTPNSTLPDPLGANCVSTSANPLNPPCIAQTASVPASGQPSARRTSAMPLPAAGTREVFMP